MSRLVLPADVGRERIDQIEPDVRKILNVTRHERHPVRKRDGCDHGVNGFNGTSDTIPVGTETPETNCRFNVK